MSKPIHLQSKKLKRAPAVTFAAERRWILGTVLVLLTMAAYARVAQCGFIWDDNFHVTENPTLLDLNGLRRIWTDVSATPQYYPLVHTSFWLEHHLCGLNPLGYHAVNVILHGFAVVLLWRVLVVLGVPGAWIGAAIFAVHPVNVESVAWITERKNVLSALFYFAAALSYLRFAAAADGMKRRWTWYLAALAFFSCALLSKTVTCSLPVALLLVTWWKSATLKWRHIFPLLPFAVIGLGLGLCTAWIEKHHVGAEGTAWSFTFIERVLIASRAIWFYAAKLLWPEKLTFIYPRWQISVSSVLQWLFPLGIIVLFAVLWSARRRIGRGPLVAVLFFACTLFPALGFVDVYPFRYSFVADHFQYLASVGLFALAGAGLSRLPRLTPFLFLAVLAALTWRQIGIYRDAETLWHDTVEKNPNSWMAQDNLAGVLLHKGQPEKALAHLRKAEEVAPDNAETQSSIGEALVRMGNMEQAFSYLGKAVELRPDIATVNYQMGNALLQAGHSDLAIPYLQKTIALDSTYLPAYDDLGNALLQAGYVEESLVPLQAALRINPNDVPARFYIANTLLQLNRPNEALVHLRGVLAAHPSDPQALKNMAWVLATSPDSALRNGSEAVRLAESANALTPREDANIGATLAAAYAEAGRFDAALETAQAALQLAVNSGNTPLAALIRSQIKLYQVGLPFRDNR
jgi:protein O-mannosyl-transferase